MNPQLIASLILLLTATPQQFEVASVKVHPPPIHEQHVVKVSGSRLTLEAFMTPALVMYAYNLKPYQMVGPSLGPWEDAYFDVAAKAEGDTPLKEADFRPMLQALLAERFHLKVHHEQREIRVYGLVVGKSGAKLKPASDDAKWQSRLNVVGRNYEITMVAATLEDIVGQLLQAGFLDRPVVDQTGLTGTYDLKLTYTPRTRANDADPDPSDINILEAVQKQLGLKLEPQKAMVDVLVVDHIEKPGEN